VIWFLSWLAAWTPTARDPHDDDDDDDSHEKTTMGDEPDAILHPFSYVSSPIVERITIFLSHSHHIRLIEESSKV
jgi:hypothetical protein